MRCAGLTVELANPYRPELFTAYLALQTPSGDMLAYDGYRDVGSDDAKPWVRDIPLPARATGRFAVSLAKLEPGDYRWHAFLTKPRPHRLVARASADFTVEP